MLLSSCFCDWLSTHVFMFSWCYSHTYSHRLPLNMPIYRWISYKRWVVFASSHCSPVRNPRRAPKSRGRWKVTWTSASNGSKKPWSTLLSRTWHRHGTCLWDCAMGQRLQREVDFTGKGETIYVIFMWWIMANSWFGAPTNIFLQDFLLFDLWLPT